MGATTKWIGAISQYLELPTDTLMGTPRIELIGTEQFRMEPHNGLLVYDPEEICVASRSGIVHISGSNLRIRLMNSSQIHIVGHIRMVSMEEGNHE